MTAQDTSQIIDSGRSYYTAEDQLRWARAQLRIATADARMLRALPGRDPHKDALADARRNVKVAAAGYARALRSLAAVGAGLPPTDPLQVYFHPAILAWVVNDTNDPGHYPAWATDRAVAEIKADDLRTIRYPAIA